MELRIILHNAPGARSGRECVCRGQLQSRGARHDLEVALEAGMHLRAIDHRARGRVVGHLLKGHRGAQHVAGELLASLGILTALCAENPQWRQASMRLRSASESAPFFTRNLSTARRKPSARRVPGTGGSATNRSSGRNAPSAANTCRCGLKVNAAPLLLGLVNLSPLVTTQNAFSASRSAGWPCSISRKRSS